MFRAVYHLLLGSAVALYFNIFFVVVCLCIWREEVVGEGPKQIWQI